MTRVVFVCLLILVYTNGVAQGSHLSKSCDALMRNMVEKDFVGAQQQCFKKCALNYFMYLTIPEIEDYKIINEKVTNEIGVVTVELNNSSEQIDLVFTLRNHTWLFFYIMPLPNPLQITSIKKTTDCLTSNRFFNTILTLDKQTATIYFVHKIETNTINLRKTSGKSYEKNCVDHSKYDQKTSFGPKSVK